MIVIRLVALVFVAAGSLVLWFGSMASSSHFEWVTVEAPLASVRYTDSKKMGRTLTLELDGHPGPYSRNFLGKIEGLEARLKDRLKEGTVVELVSVTRPSAGEYASLSIPLAIHELRQGGELLFDEKMFSGNDWIVTAARIFGGVMAAGGLLLLLVSFRRTSG